VIERSFSAIQGIENGVLLMTLTSIRLSSMTPSQVFRISHVDKTSDHREECR